MCAAVVQGAAFAVLTFSMRFDLKQPLTSPYPRRPWSLRARAGHVAHPIPFRRLKRIEPLYRWARWALILQMTLPLGYLLAVAVIVQLPRTSSMRQWYFDLIAPISSFVIWGSLFLMIVLQTALALIARRRLKRRLINARCQLCHSCGYGLQGRDRDQLACPECAYKISRRECVRLWCKMLRSRL